ncbi:hypothetical protein [Limnoraphis robusta]|uniref:Uncharacterized protein n=1 Tax=Limnoraphis robusta CCNP1315 TaxID=3110306 RepID=A0ABU5U319_9CYAN|nr:hypothetical protein [Limnoraphis robusta]MEA5521028.1 hypothetical protein [Limnoraphis robusta CCNP1315]MEA5543527.1 hypothetical protein [Limnoraphis robusta CCNP1324]
MSKGLETSRLQQALDIVESLSIEEQDLIVEILTKRLQRNRRENLLQEIQEIRQEASEGMITVGSVDYFLRELDTL